MNLRNRVALIAAFWCSLLQVPCFGSAELLAQLRRAVVAEPEGGSLTGTYKSGGHSFHYDFDWTSKGNGLLVLGGIALRVYDSHADGSLLENEYLEIESGRINGQSVLVVTGVGLWTGEKGRDQLRAPVAVILSVRDGARLEVEFENDGAKSMEIVQARKK